MTIDRDPVSGRRERATRFLTEAPPRVRWQIGRLRTSLLYRPAFARVGRGSVIVSPAVLRGVESITIGQACAIYGGAWLQCESPGGTIRIGDDVYMGHRCHVHALDPVSVGDGCFFADDVLVTSGDHRSGIDRGATRGTGEIAIGSGVFLGQRSIVLGGVTIGAGATIGAAAVVTRDVGPGVTVAGVPARPVGGTR